MKENLLGQIPGAHVFASGSNRVDFRSDMTHSLKGRNGRLRLTYLFEALTRQGDSVQPSFLGNLDSSYSLDDTKLFFNPPDSDFQYICLE